MSSILLQWHTKLNTDVRSLGLLQLNPVQMHAHHSFSCSSSYLSSYIFLFWEPNSTVKCLCTFPVKLFVGDKSSVNYC